MLRLLIIAALLWALPARAEEVVLGLSQDEVAITATFDGSSLLIFGAVKREEPLPRDSDLDVIITVSGPPGPLDVRRKERRMGIWVNTDSVHLLHAPSFYAVASTRPLDQILNLDEDQHHIISVDYVMTTVGPAHAAPDLDVFTDALVRIRSEAELYQQHETGVALDQQTLFRTSLDLPANLVEGIYSTRIFLVRDGAVIDRYDTTIEVHKVGIERWLYNLAHDRPLAYGIMSLVIAIAAGWLASAAFRMFQR
ncbi:TIGR02186 family protein [Fluviibacterium sp. DFM31]|uniref:TIGR02186 family protein n=1 Tax=Meridianimarinicoccus marinus TaxID=3231483 RepID=A0ABV3L2P5_9RHOB